MVRRIYIYIYMMPQTSICKRFARRFASPHKALFMYWLSALLKSKAPGFWQLAIYLCFFFLLLHPRSIRRLRQSMDGGVETWMCILASTLHFRPGTVGPPPLCRPGMAAPSAPRASGGRLLSRSSAGFLASSPFLSSFLLLPGRAPAQAPPRT